MTEKEIDECKAILAKRNKTNKTAGLPTIIAIPKAERESRYSVNERERRVLVGKNAIVPALRKIWA
jgi:hypothetical protein